MGVWYATREAVKAALDSKVTARDDAQVDDAIESASRGIEGLTHRRYYPQLAARTFDWPNTQYARPWRLWLDANDLISVTTLVAGGATIPAADFFLRRSDDRDEPPYTHVEIDLDSSSAFSSGGTHQRAIVITGLFGYGADEAPAGALAEALDASETEVDVTNSAIIGVGSIIRADSERMIVTGKANLDTGQNLAGGLTTAQANDVAATVTDGSAYFVGETLLTDSERLLVVDIAGNVLTVKRAWDGSVLATHTTPDIYAPRRLTVERGALGTTAATHSNGAALVRHVVPGTIRSLCIAEAISQVQQEQAGYGRVVGSGDNEREASGKGLADLRQQAYTRYGRKARVRAI